MNKVNNLTSVVKTHMAHMPKHSICFTFMTSCVVVSYGCSCNKNLTSSCYSVCGKTLKVMYGCVDILKPCVVVDVVVVIF